MEADLGSPTQTSHERRRDHTIVTATAGAAAVMEAAPPQAPPDPNKEKPKGCSPGSSFAI